MVCCGGVVGPVGGGGGGGGGIRPAPRYAGGGCAPSHAERGKISLLGLPTLNFAVLACLTCVQKITNS